MSASEMLPSRRCFCSTRRSEGDSSERQASRPLPPPRPPLPSEESPENARRPDDDPPDDECSAVALSPRPARSNGEAPGHPGVQTRSAPARGAGSSAVRAGWALVAGGRRASSREPCSTGATKAAAAALERALKCPAATGAGRASGAARLAAGWCARCTSSADTARSS